MIQLELAETARWVFQMDFPNHRATCDRARTEYSSNIQRAQFSNAARTKCENLALLPKLARDRAY